MASLSQERWKQIDEVFAAALEQPAAARAAFLDEACAGDPALRREVERLLDSSEEAEEVLGESVTVFAQPLLPELHDLLAGEDVPKEQVGAYQLLDEVGRGGMGRVFRARRADGAFDKIVALKLVKRGMDSDEILRRFRHERQVLARLDHPHIARLLDGGRAGDGRPYLVMEYVDGVTVDRYCDARRLSVEERLRLFQDVCAAVQYAHQNLVVHRDLKPSNILVTEEDGAPTVKLLDFGIAKLMSDEDEATAPLTRTGVRPMTPEYAAPEQLAGASVTTATDIYTLGVVLYELLTGQRPHALRGKSRAEAERVVLHGEPERPSTAVTRTLTKTASGSATTVTPQDRSAVRGLTPERLQQRLRGDLDVIVLKALRKEPTERYASAEAFLEDVRRHLEGLPVQARPQTVGYRVRTFVRRHRLGVATAALFVLLLAGFAAAMTWQRAEAARERDAAEEIAVFLEDLFAAPDPTAAERLDTLRVGALLARGVERVQEELGDRPAVQARLLHVLGRTYIRLERDAEAVPLLEEALALRRRAAEPLEVAETKAELAHALEEVERFDEAAALASDALDVRRQRLGPRHETTAASMRQVARLMFWRRSGEDGDAWQRRQADGEALLREALAIQHDRLGPDHAEATATLEQLATLYMAQARYEEALALYEGDIRPAVEARYGARHPRVGNVLGSQAFLEMALGRNEEADAHLREALAIQRDAYGASSLVAQTLTTHGIVLRKLERYGDAEAALREALTMPFRRPADRAIALSALASALQEQGAYAEAEGPQREATQIMEAVRGPSYPTVIAAKVKLAAILQAQARYVEAETLLLEAHDARADAGPDPHNHGADRTAEALAALYDAWGHPEKAAAYRPEPR